MKKVSIIITLFVLIISIFIIKMQAVSNPPEKILYEAFKSSGAATVSSELYLRGKIGGWGKAREDFGKALIMDVLKDFGTAEINPGIDSAGGPDTAGKELDCSLGGSRRIHFNIVDGKDSGDPGESYVAISLVDTSRAPDLAGDRAVLEKALNKHGIRPKFNSCITGSFEGKKDNSALNEACVRIFTKADAKKVEGIREGSLISVSAFSGAIKEAVDDNGSKVNLNLAIRYNSYEDKTYLWLATPVITTEY